MGMADALHLSLELQCLEQPLQICRPRKKTEHRQTPRLIHYRMLLSLTSAEGLLYWPVFGDAASAARAADGVADSARTSVDALRWRHMTPGKKMQRLTPEKISEVMKRALRQSDLIGEEDTAVIFYDLSRISECLTHLRSLFPQGTLHAIAIKANPLGEILRYITGHGAGLEAASLPELCLAERTGISPNMIVFDSPVKTDLDLKYALNLGVHINADSRAELERIAALLQNTTARSTIGIRINPQVGPGSIVTTSVAGNYSKFGVAIRENRRELIRSFLEFSWLRGVHVHIGSQGCTADLLLRGVAEVIDFVNEANRRLGESKPGRQIDVLDIGGGFPVAYDRLSKPESMEAYAARIVSLLRNCSSDNLRLITEFGRYVHANAGWVASRVEYVKSSPSFDTAMIHIGADLLLRECYRPNDWHHDISLLDREGRLKAGGETRNYVLAGPLCFAEDVIARGTELPLIEQGDYVIVHDIGAYTLSMWSRYNSRQVPKVVGYTDDGKAFRILKDRESLEDIWRFWS